MRIITLVLAAIAIPAHAQDGGQLYNLYCGACHAPDGKGATGGAFPPLAGSDWIDENSERSIKTVLHGLTGPIEVNGKPFNLEMPPQGAALNDATIASILTYVHTSWGNKGKPVTAELVKAVREKTADRDKPWTAPEILKLHPLDATETALDNLISRVYKGQWRDIPHFDKLQPESFEEEHSGIISVSQAPFKEHFGIVWEGDFVAPKTGQYTFNLDADDGAKLTLNGKTIAEVRGTGPMNGQRAKQGKIKLNEGKNKIRIDFFQAAGPAGIALSWKGPGVKDWQWLSDATPEPKPPWPSIVLAPQDRPVIYRNFVQGTTPRAIGFGFPGGLNLAYSADHLAPEIVWSGEFIDAGRHWTNRGQGNQEVAGETIHHLTKKRFLPENARFKGYRLDEQGNPTFIVTIGEQTLTDFWKPSGKDLTRTLTLSGGGSTLDIELGNPAITGAEKITLSPNQATTISYVLR